MTGNIYPRRRRYSPESNAGMIDAQLQACGIVGAMVAVAWEGPQLTTFEVLLPLGVAPSKVARLGDAVALAMGAGNVRIDRDGDRLVIEAAKPEEDRATLPAREVERAARGRGKVGGLKVTLGPDTLGSLVYLDLADPNTCHCLVAGTTGSGKSRLVQWLLWQLAMANKPESLWLLALDPKRIELAGGAFARLPHLLHPVAVNTWDMARLLDWILAEVDRRLDAEEPSPALVVVIEEVADCGARVPELVPALERILQIARGIGVVVIASTQQPGAKVLGDSIANWPVRLLGRVASATLTFGAAGKAKTGASELLGFGDFLRIVGGDVVRFQCPLLAPRDLGRLPRAEVVASLDLLSLAEFADKQRDARGGRGATELTRADYKAIEAMLEEGATAEEIRQRFGIGRTRAQRIAGTYHELRQEVDAWEESL